MANTTNERAMDWEDTIENESNFRIIPEGDYSFTVSKPTRARYNGGAKIGPCPKAILDNLLLHTRCEGLLCAFFTCIGQRKHGQPLKMNWAAVPGARGRAHIGIRKWTSEKDNQERESNEVTRFLDPETAPAAPTPSFTPGDF